MRVAVAPGGAVRAIYDDAIGWRRLGIFPKRASRVEAITEGPNRGLFHADMSLLGDEHQVCLWPPRADYRRAVADEIAYLHARWVQPQRP